MTTRLCSAQKKHQGSPIIGVCLEETCEQQPLACRRCIKELHQGHLIVTLKHLFESYRSAKPLQSSVQLFQKQYSEEQKLQKLAYQSCQSLMSASARIYERISEERPFIDLYQSSLKRQQIPQIANYISSSKELPQQTIKQFLPILRLYYFKGAYQLSSAKKQNSELCKRFSQLFIKAEQQIKLIITNLEQNIDKYCNKNQQQLGESLVKEQDGGQKSVMEKREAGKIKSRMIDENEVKIQDEANTEKERKKYMLQKFNLVRKQEEKEKKVVLRQTKQAQINILIHYIDPTKIIELTISNSSSPCVADQKARQHIAKMLHLRLLRMFWVRQLTDIEACKMIKDLSSLEELCLCEFENCSPFFVNALKLNNPKIKKLCFTMDPLHFVRYNEENIEFLPDTVCHFQEESTWISLSRGLRDLTNLQLYHPQNKPYWIHYLKTNCLKLSQLTISNIDQSDDSRKRGKSSNQNFVLKMLADCRNLRCLRFEQINFEEKTLIKMIENNPKIQSFIATECPSCITNKTYTALSKHAGQIQELSIQMDDQFYIQSIWNMSPLKTLVIRGCWGVNEEKFIEILAKQNKIKCLSIDFNYEWVTARTLKALGKLANLKVLNISGNNLKNQDIQSLASIPYLNTLICYNNDFSLAPLAACSLAKTLKKLSIGKNLALYPNEKDYEQMQMNLLVESFPSLTHLKLRGFKEIKPEFLDLLPRLICFTVIEAPSSDIFISKQYCQHNKIYFNTNQQ